MKNCKLSLSQLIYNYDKLLVNLFYFDKKFQLMITLEDMLGSSVHLGHPVKQWNPKMGPYIYGERNGIHLIDIIQTIVCLEKANEYIFKMSKENKTFKI